MTLGELTSQATTAEWVTAIAAAVAAVFGGGSLLLGLSILWRDRARSVAAQAAQVACWRRWPITTELTARPLPAGGQGPAAGARVVVDEAALGTSRVETDEVHLHNASDRPITEVGIRTRKMTRAELRTAFQPGRVARFATPYDEAAVGFSNGLLTPSHPSYNGVIMPGEIAVRDMALRDELPEYCRRWVTFRDVNGVRWLRDLSDGRLLKAGSLRATFRQRRGLWRATWRGDGRAGYRWWING